MTCTSLEERFEDATGDACGSDMVDIMENREEKQYGRIKQKDNEKRGGGTPL